IRDPRFETRKQRTDRHEEIVSILRAQFREKPREYWLSKLDANSIPNAPINTIHEVFDNPQIKHMRIRTQINHTQNRLSIHRWAAATWLAVRSICRIHRPVMFARHRYSGSRPRKSWKSWVTGKK